MVGKVMTIRFEVGMEWSNYRIVTLNGQVDCFDVINMNVPHKQTFYRKEIDKELFEKALYLAAKQKPKSFKEIYNELKKHDPEYFVIAKKVLDRIHSEYDYE